MDIDSRVSSESRTVWCRSSERFKQVTLTWDFLPFYSKINPDASSSTSYTTLFFSLHSLLAIFKFSSQIPKVTTITSKHLPTLLTTTTTAETEVEVYLATNYLHKAANQEKQRSATNKNNNHIIIPSSSSSSSPPCPPRRIITVKATTTTKWIRQLQQHHQQRFKNVPRRFLSLV